MLALWLEKLSIKRAGSSGASTELFCHPKKATSLTSRKG